MKRTIVFGATFIGIYAILTVLGLEPELFKNTPSGWFWVNDHYTVNVPGLIGMGFILAFAAGVGAKVGSRVAETAEEVVPDAAPQVLKNVGAKVNPFKGKTAAPAPVTPSPADDHAAPAAGATG